MIFTRKSDLAGFTCYFTFAQKSCSIVTKGGHRFGCDEERAILKRQLSPSKEKEVGELCIMHAL